MTALKAFKNKTFAWVLGAGLAVQGTAHAETLAEVFALAQQNDTLIRSQRATYMANRETENIGRSALLPQVDFNGGYSEATIDNNLVSGPNSERDVDTENYDLTLNQTLFNLETWYTFRQGKKISQQAEAQLLSDEQDLILRVVQAYTDVLAAIDAYETAKASEAAIGRQLEQTRQRFEVGLVAVTEVYESQATYDNAVVTSLTTKGDIGIQFEALETLTGQPIETIAPLITDFEVRDPVPAGRDEWVSLALENNADLKVSQLSMESSLQNAKAKRAAHYPTVSGTYQLNNDDTNNDPALIAGDIDQESEILSVNLRVPIFSGLGVSASRRQAWEQYNAATELYGNTKRTTIQSARSLHLAVTTDVARVAAQKQAIVSARSALDATQAGYDAGTRNIVDVLNAEQALYLAQNNWHNSRYQYINDMLNLKKVSGTLVAEEVETFSRATDGMNQISRFDFD